MRAAAAHLPRVLRPPESPRGILVLRNNDIGDLLVITPLFEALKQRFPDTCVAAGVGSWSFDVLRHNPHVSEVVPVNAPWFNKYTGAAGAARRFSYLGSVEARALRLSHFDIGIDVLGSAWGSLLLLRAGIPYRLGVRGYAGGHSAAQACVEFDPDLHVGRAALRFAELLGATRLPPVRPQLFLAAEERRAGEEWWQGATGRRIVLGPGGGVPARRWPISCYARLAAQLARDPSVDLAVVTGRGEDDLLAALLATAPEARHSTETLGLRQLFGLVAASDLVVCNSSMLLHVAAAFAKPVFVLLGETFPSAARHQLQWGYEGLSVSRGKEAGQGSLVTPDEATSEIRAFSASRRGTG